LKLKDALQDFLIPYRVTPHCTIGVTPSEKMFNRQIYNMYIYYMRTKQNKNTKMRKHKLK